MKYTTNSLHEGKIYNTYRETDSGEKLAVTLATMAGEEGIPVANSVTLAEKIMAEVEHYEDTCDLVSEDVHAAMESVFDSLSRLEPEARMEAMDQMLFGFTLFSDEEALAKLKNGISGEALYQQSCSRIPYSPEAEAELQKKLMAKAENLRLSRGALERMRTALRNSGDYVATSAALGRDGYTLKCAVAMDMYLRNREHITPEEAVLNACCFVDLEAIADGVRVGEILETVSCGLTAVRVVVMFCKVTSLMVAAKSLSEFFLIALVGVVMMEAATMVGMFLSRQIGKLGVVGARLVKSGAETLAEGFDRICAAAEAETEETNYVDATYYNVENEVEFI